MLQLVRHEFSQKRYRLFTNEKNRINHSNDSLLEEYAELVNEEQAESLNERKMQTIIEKHVRVVRKQIEKLYSSFKPLSSKPKIIVPQTIKRAEEIEQKMNERIQNHKQFQSDEDYEAEEKN